VIDIYRVYTMLYCIVFISLCYYFGWVNIIDNYLIVGWVWTVKELLGWLVKISPVTSMVMIPSWMSSSHNKPTKLKANFLISTKIRSKIRPNLTIRNRIRVTTRSRCLKIVSKEIQYISWTEGRASWFNLIGNRVIYHSWVSIRTRSSKQGNLKTMTRI